MATVLEFTVLNDQEISGALAHLTGWERQGEKLAKTFECASFFEAVALVNRVAVVAEKLNHHPDIAIHYKKVSFSLWTHKTGGITQADIVLAAMIQEVSFQPAAAH